MRHFNVEELLTKYLCNQNFKKKRLFDKEFPLKELEGPVILRHKRQIGKKRFKFAVTNVRDLDPDL